MKFLPLAGVLLVTFCGCSDKKTATKGNFENALNQHLSHFRKCVLFNDSDALVNAVPDNRSLDVLATSGMLTRTQMPSGSSSQPMFRYALTGEAKGTREDIVPPAGKPRVGYLCSGRLVVDNIIDFTEPAEEHGVHETQVNYRTRLTGVPAWSENPTFTREFPFFQPIATREGMKDKQTLVLTSDGWKVNGD